MDALLRLYVLCGLVLAGCSKSKDTAPPATLSTLRQLSFSTISSLPALPPAPAQMYFSYDFSGRVTQVFMHRGAPTLTVASGDSLCYLQFFYTSGNSLPSSAFERSRIGTGSLNNQQHYFTYDVQDRLQQDSVIYNNGNSRFYQYDYSGDYGTVSTGTSANALSVVDSFIVLGNNEIAYYRLSLNPVTSYRLAHDNQINPFDQLNIAPVFNSISLHPGHPFNEHLQALLPVAGQNNVTEVMEYTNGLLTQTHTLSYTYNGEGLPLRRIWSFSNPTTVQDTLLFIY